MTDSTNYFIAWWSAVYSRLAYLNPQDFLGRYTEIFGEKVGKINNGMGATSDDLSGGALPTTSVLDMMQKQAIGKGIPGLLDDKVMLALQNANEKRWGLNVVAVDALNASVKPTTLTLDCITNYGPDGKPADTFGEASAVASWAEKVNIILGERRKIKEDKKNPASMTPEMLNCAPALMLKDNPMLVFRAISDSNYGTTYVFGDKRAPNLVWVVFRGTANAKSALAYSRPSSLTPTKLVEFFGIIDAGLIGIFKILQEQIHVIIQMAVDVATELNPGVALAPGSIKLLTTGHSLGGAMATAFAGEYVQQISPDLTRIVGASIFDVSIGCYSLASPRVFGPKQAAAFCCLTQASELCKTDPDAAVVVVPDSYVKGRISYLRVVTTLDLVTALPKVGYEHPCSEFKKGQREMITMDCDIEVDKTIVSNGNAFITNKVSTRCLNLAHKRPAMTADFSKAPVCTYKRKKTLSMSSMLYHLTYCGIMFAGGVDMSSALSLDVERLQPGDVAAAAVDPVALNIKVNDTMMRILWYGYNNEQKAKCVFFDLAPFRVNETMAQSGGGFFDRFKGSNKVAPAPQTTPAPATAQPAPAPPKTGFLGFGKKPAAAPTPAPAAPAAPATGSVPVSDSAVLLEDAQMTNEFIVGLKEAIAIPKYDYPITTAAFKPPILYKSLSPSKGGAPPPQEYDYLYQLPAKIGTSGSRFTLFFGNNPPPPAPPRPLDANGEPILTADEQNHIDNHHNLVSDVHAAAANTAVAGINAAQGTPAPAPAPAPNPNITIQNVLPTTVPPNETKATSITQIQPTTTTKAPFSPTLINLPDNFGPSTTMSEVANYFAKVVLIELMSKFDVNTNMNLSDLLSVMSKNNSNTGSNNNGNGNGSGSGSGSGNGSGIGSGNGSGNGNNRVNTTNNSTSADLFNNLNANVNPGVDNTNNNNMNQNSANNTDTPVSSNNDMGMGSMGMGMGMGMPGFDMNNMGMGNQDDVTPKDTRSRLDIQNENANMELDNARRSADNKELGEKIAKHEAELEELRKTPGSDPAKIKDLERNILEHKNTIAINENVMTDNERKKKANKSAEYKLKSNYEVASEVGKSAYDVTKRGVNAVGNAASDALTSAQDLASRAKYGKDISVLNDEHKALTDKKTAEETNIKKLEEELKGADVKRANQIRGEIDNAGKKVVALDKQITNKEAERTRQQTKIDAIKNKYTSNETTTTVPHSEIVPHSEVAPINASTHTGVSPHHDVNVHPHSTAIPHVHDSGEHNKSPGFFSRHASSLNNTFKRMGNIGYHHKNGGKKTKTKKNKKITKKVNIE